MGLDEINIRLNADPVLRGIFQELEDTNRELAIRGAAKDPKKYRLSHYIADGKSTSYRYVNAGDVRICYATWKNIAGYYLGWVERENEHTVKRTQWTAHKTRKAARAMAERWAADWK